MFETLQKFQSVKVRPFETDVERRSATTICVIQGTGEWRKWQN